MKEELGITAFIEPEFLYTYINSNPYETELVHTYSYVNSEEIRFNKDEIDEVRPWVMDDILENLGRGIFSDNFEHEIKTYIKFKDRPKDKKT
jgi:hypothetical protein